jgi:hypothetical protein
MDYRPFSMSLANSLSRTMISPDRERVGLTLPRWIKLNIVKKSTPMASAAWVMVKHCVVLAGRG